MNKIPLELKKTILWRLATTIPINLKLSVGNKGTFTTEELKVHVEKEDEIGVLFADMQLKFMKALASGDFTKAIA